MTDPRPDNEPRDETQALDRRLLTYRRLMVIVGMALALALLVLFIADNFVLIEIRLFTIRIRARLAWAMVVPLLIGLAVGVLVGRGTRNRSMV